jgi:hypothetical protein
MTIFLSACTQLKVINTDPKTGYFPASSKATVIKSTPIDLDSKKALILVPKPDFIEGQIRNIGYFDEVISFETLEKNIVAANLSEKVPSVRDRIGINNAAKNYKYFLWFRVDSTGSGNNTHTQFILTDPITLEDYFIVDTHLDYLWSGVNDQNNWYPMFNALIDYIKENSKTYKK